MNHRVQQKQQNSSMCLVCGLKNPFGLKGSFYEMETGELICLFTPSDVHQSYPGRLHGGIAAAILDETIGRAIMMKYDQMVWGVTFEFSIRYQKPIPLDRELRVVGRITIEAGRTFEGEGKILLPDSGAVAATGYGKYMKMPIEKIADFDVAEQEWKVTPSDGDPAFIEY
ncbi:MAG: PaaI family thioesterase [Acidobacteriota bacterium]|jgi:acyl-coenzyme A thioesterase PaaI-like protein